MGTVLFNTDIEKTVDINKLVNLDVTKNVDVAVNINGRLATAEASADALGENALAETDTFAQVTDSGAFSFSESLAASAPSNIPLPGPIAIPDPDPTGPGIFTELDDQDSVTRTTVIDVVANDQGNPDPTTVAIAVDPAEGTATPNADGTVTYTTTLGNTPGVDDSTTDNFLYNVANSGGVSNDAQVTVNIVDPGEQSVDDPGTLGTLLVKTDERTADETAFIEGQISTVVGDTFNIAYIIDVSGSTAGAFDFSDPASPTIFEAEVEFFKVLTDGLVASGFGDAEADIGLISFDGSAQFLGTFDPVADRAALDAALDGSFTGGGTDFDPPLQEALTWYNSQPVATNLMYFMSDGFGFVTFSGSVDPLDALPSARVGIGVGPGSSLDQLDLVDNTPPAPGGTAGEPNASASQVLTPDELLALIPGAIFSAEAIDFSVTVNGVDQGRGVGDLVEGPLGLTFGPFETDDLDPSSGAVNNFVATVTLDEDGDPATTDDQETLSVDADIFGFGVA